MSSARSGPQTTDWQFQISVDADYLKVHEILPFIHCVKGLLSKKCCYCRFQRRYKVIEQ
jgi:hypothetical protein